MCQHTDLNNYTCHTRHKHSYMYGKSIELSGRENLMYAYVPLNFNRNYFKLFFKTKSSYGLIFYIGDTTYSIFSQYLSLTIVNGFIKFAAKLDQDASEIYLRSKQRIDDGRWHRIEIERFSLSFIEVYQK